MGEAIFLAAAAGCRPTAFYGGKGPFGGVFHRNGAAIAAISLNGQVSDPSVVAVPELTAPHPPALAEPGF
jgi:hypothetical protein